MIDNGPTLIFPNGGETFTRNTITITWFEPTDITDSTDLVFNEILFTESYERFDKNEWLQVALVPKGITSYVWNVSPHVKSLEGRVGIRAVNHKGERSKISYSAAPISIRDRHLPVPAVIEPTEGKNYFLSVPIAIDYNGVIGQTSERAFYQVFYRSESLGIDWTLIASNIRIGEDPIFWNVKNINSSDDYEMRIELIDQGFRSNPLFIKKLKINNYNFFLLDTLPPKGIVNIVNNIQFIKDRDLVLDLAAFDTTTEVETVRIEQEDIGADSNPVPSPYLPMTDVQTYRIKSPVAGGNTDGVKLIEARYKDSAGNILVDNKFDFFRTFESQNNDEVSAFLTVQDDEDFSLFYKYTAFTGITHQLFQDNRFLVELDGKATDLAFFNSLLYIAIEQNRNIGILQRFVSNQIETVITLIEEDSVINSMEVFNSKLYMGLANGKLLSFNGGTITTENQDNLFISSILKLETNGNVLFIFFDSTEDIVVLNIDSNGNNRFTTII